MNIWDAIFGLIGAVILSTSESARDLKDKTEKKYDRYYENSCDRYERMSDERLKKEVTRLKTSNEGSALEKAARASALKNELDKR